MTVDICDSSTDLYSLKSRQLGEQITAAQKKAYSINTELTRQADIKKGIEHRFNSILERIAQEVRVKREPKEALLRLSYFSQEANKSAKSLTSQKERISLLKKEQSNVLKSVQIDESRLANVKDVLSKRKSVAAQRRACTELESLSELRAIGNKPGCTSSGLFSSIASDDHRRQIRTDQREEDDISNLNLGRSEDDCINPEAQILSARSNRFLARDDSQVGMEVKFEREPPSTGGSVESNSYVHCSAAECASNLDEFLSWENGGVRGISVKYTLPNGSRISLEVKEQQDSVEIDMHAMDSSVRQLLAGEKVLLQKRLSEAGINVRAITIHQEEK